VVVGFFQIQVEELLFLAELLALSSNQQPLLRQEPPQSSQEEAFSVALEQEQPLQDPFSVEVPSFRNQALKEASSVMLVGHYSVTRLPSLVEQMLSKELQREMKAMKMKMTVRVMTSLSKLMMSLLPLPVMTRQRI
jgi:hypothetical protein